LIKKNRKQASSAPAEAELQPNEAPAPEEPAAAPAAE
jgi:hypothetical protein